MKICGVVVWYNPSDEEVRNISTYLNHVDRVIVVDNSSNDNRYLLNGINKIEYIANNENLGIAKALNIGCYKSIEYGYEYALTMDQDSRFDKDMIEKFINLFHEKIKEDKSIAIFAPLTDDAEKKGYVEKIITSGNILDLNAFKVVNGFDDDLFIDEVDFDLCFKLLKNNYKLYRFKEVRLNHKLGNTKEIKILNKKISTMNHSHIRKYYIVRNRFIMRSRYPEFTNGYLKDTIKYVIKVILIEDEKYKKCKYILKGYFDYRKNILGKINE